MVTLTPDRPISPLRQRMLDDMAVRGLASNTQRDYIRFAAKFATFLKWSPDTTTPEDVRRFQIYQREQGAQPPTINSRSQPLRFFLTMTLRRPIWRSSW